jgi:hypothetical protein
VSLQIAILKVLSSYADGKAPLDAIKSDLAILAGAGREWDQRLKRLATRAPRLDIFGQHLVLKDGANWVLTAAGREMLRHLETPAPVKPALIVVARSDSPVIPEPSMARDHQRRRAGIRAAY